DLAIETPCARMRARNLSARIASLEAAIRVTCYLIRVTFYPARALSPHHGAATRRARSASVAQQSGGDFECARPAREVSDHLVTLPNCKGASHTAARHPQKNEIIHRTNASEAAEIQV